MKNVRSFSLAIASLLCLSSLVYSYFRVTSTVESITRNSLALIAMLDDEQKAKVVQPADSELRPDWHIIPKPTRKGLQILEMNDQQRAAAHGLLKSVLSDVGYNKTTKIMHMENLLEEFERGKGNTPYRDPYRYYFTIFGQPDQSKRWGISIEGHHMSLNFLIEGDHVVSSSPLALAANPAIVRNENETGVEIGTRILKKEETLAFDLVHSLTPDQKAKAILSDKAPAEVRNLGIPQPPKDAAVGISFSELSRMQQNLLKELVGEYIHNVPEQIADQRLQEIYENGGWNQVKFMWEGATVPGIGHYYRVQGPSFLIEFVNTQPDAAGNIANHIHSVWRDPRGDFGVR